MHSTHVQYQVVQRPSGAVRDVGRQIRAGDDVGERRRITLERDEVRLTRQHGFMMPRGDPPDRTAGFRSRRMRVRVSEGLPASRNCAFHRPIDCSDTFCLRTATATVTSPAMIDITIRNFLSAGITCGLVIDIDSLR